LHLLRRREATRCGAKEQGISGRGGRPGVLTTPAAASPEVTGAPYARRLPHAPRRRHLGERRGRARRLGGRRRWERRGGRQRGGAVRHPRPRLRRAHRRRVARRPRPAGDLPRGGTDRARRHPPPGGRGRSRRRRAHGLGAEFEPGVDVGRSGGVARRGVRAGVGGRSLGLGGSPADRHPGAAGRDPGAAAPGARARLGGDHRVEMARALGKRRGPLAVLGGRRAVEPDVGPLPELPVSPAVGRSDERPGVDEGRRQPVTTPIRAGSSATGSTREPSRSARSATSRGRRRFRTGEQVRARERGGAARPGGGVVLRRGDVEEPRLAHGRRRSRGARPRDRPPHARHRHRGERRPGRRPHAARVQLRAGLLGQRRARRRHLAPRRGGSGHHPPGGARLRDRSRRARHRPGRRLERGGSPSTASRSWKPPSGTSMATAATCGPGPWRRSG